MGTESPYSSHPPTIRAFPPFYEHFYQLPPGSDSGLLIFPTQVDGEGARCLGLGSPQPGPASQGTPQNFFPGTCTLGNAPKLFPETCTAGDIPKLLPWDLQPKGCPKTAPPGPVPQGMP